jgi:large subunit ribosomal protein L23
MIKPVFTEKSLKMARTGQYSFWVDRDMDKLNLKSVIAKMFGVHVLSIKTVKKAGEKGRSVRGRKFEKLQLKKAVVTIKDGEKIDAFEENKK